MTSEPLRYCHMDTPFGPVLLAGDEAGLRRLDFRNARSTIAARSRGRKAGRDSSIAPDWSEDPKPFREVVRQLDLYFAGRLRDFDVPLAPEGTPFQLRVWEALCGIPYGETTSYGAVAARIGRPSASRAVGMANGRNPISIIVPCHRVIGSTGALTGYGGGIEMKARLLAFERETSSPRRRPAATAP